MRLLGFRFAFVMICALAVFTVRPAQAGLFGPDTRDQCTEKYARYAPTIFLSSFYYQICETLSEPEPKIENKMFFAPVPKPKDCRDYSPSANYITPHELGICRIDRWKLRQKWAKCRLDKKESPDVQTDRAVELVISGQDSSDCGPWASIIDPNPVAGACVWPVCPFWSLTPQVPSVIDKFALHTSVIVHSESNMLQCAEVRNTVNAMIALYDANPTGYKKAAEYAELKKKLDNLPYPELPCPADALSVVAPESSSDAPSDASSGAVDPPPAADQPPPAAAPDAPAEPQPSALPQIPSDSDQPKPRMIFQ